jgi:dTMP kinase
MRGRCSFIVFEGADGCGKTTQAGLLYDRLTELGVPCVLTEEPGATATGQIIREHLLHPDSCMDPKTELFLFLADRAEHAAVVLQPALQQGKTVICSRYFFSTLVYQGLVRKSAPPELLLQMNLFAVKDLLPDLVFYFDVDPERGLALAQSETARTSSGYRGGDRIEREGTPFQEQVRQGYLEMASRFPDLFVNIETNNRSKSSIADEVYSHVERRCL